MPGLSAAALNPECNWLGSNLDKKLGVIVGKDRSGLAGIAAFEEEVIVVIQNKKRLHCWLVANIVKLYSKYCIPRKI